MRRLQPPPTIRVDVFFHDERAEQQFIHYWSEIMSALDDLRAEVAESRTVTESAIQLLQGLKQQLDEAIATGDPGALVELSAELDSQTNRLAEAVTLNTPGTGGDEEPEEPTEPTEPSEPTPESFAGQVPASARRRTR